eukprot:CAMPEP_0171302614 /NCGR_PEP_ID=MMETSP0816-20121228/12035_1 /TAXON_ID=420281 /ORGANISM="Proboscia inermis, Strain CCAP1064/1" /LENGTH=235 /DNA_ID=CAMNT_0011781227 /DNA_START=192 /DNA_END=899 /DNA_ORIENTATION=-
MNVCELGAGCGLPGLVASHFAKKVALSDGNDVVLDLLRDNAQNHELVRERKHRTGNTEQGPEIQNEFETASKLFETSKCRISVQKCVWGDRSHLLSIRDVFGCQGADVIVGADVVQWPSVVEPLLHTVKALLWDSKVEKEVAGKYPTFVLGIVKRATSISNQFFELARNMGFTSSKIPAELYLKHGVVPDECKEYGGRITEIYELTLTDRSVPPVMLERDVIIGETYENVLATPY